MPATFSNLRTHFSLAATVLAIVTLLLGDGALASWVAGLIVLPRAYAGDVDDIAGAARDGRFRD